MRPWDYNLELTEERLIQIAQLLERGRGDAVDRYDPTVGDDSWTLGCCAYNYGCFQVRSAAETSGFEWLRVINPGKHFQFSVGHVPMRFWKGDPSDPTDKISAATAYEQLPLDLEPGVSLAGVLIRIGVVTDFDGALIGASFVALRNGEPETVWPLPLADAAPLIVGLGSDAPAGRELPPPSVGDIQDEQDENGDEAAETPDGG